MLQYKVVQDEIKRLEKKLSDIDFQLKVTKDIYNKKIEQLKSLCPHLKNKFYRDLYQSYYYCEDCKTYLYNKEDYGFNFIN